MLIKIALSLLFCSLALCSAISYDGYKIYDINAKNLFEKEVLLRLSSNEQYDFFALPKLMGETTRVMVQPKDQLDFEALLYRFGLDYTIVNENVGDSLHSFGPRQFEYFDSTLPR